MYTALAAMQGSRWRVWQVMVVVVVCRGAMGASGVRVVNHGYEGLVVGVSPDVPESSADTVINSIKELIKDASTDLLVATEGKLYFKDVRILIPYAWKNTKIDQPADTEKYLESDIRIDPTINPLHHHRPYTRHLDGCGDPGEYIHLTPTYLSNYEYANAFGSRSKTLVMEWAKFRWGVFDEIGYMNDDKFPAFYYKQQDPYAQPDVGGTLNHEATLCADTHVYGKDRLYGAPDQECTELKDGLPAGQCYFFPDPDQTATSSLMSYPSIRNDSVIKFCDHTTHNVEAPTRQNDICKRKSAWDVMNLHEDFKNNPLPISDVVPDPNVVVVRQVPANYVLVLDYSGSMDVNDRMELLQKEAQRYILNDVAIDSSVAIVRFDDDSEVLAPLTTVRNDADRRRLADAVHPNNGGGTSIGAGLVEALGLLSNQLNKNILLITDGEENAAPMIADVIDRVKASDVCVTAIAIGPSASEKLEDLAHATGCITFTVQDNDVSNAMGNAFDAVSTSQPYVPTLIHQKITELDKTKTGASYYEDTFDVDSTIGRNLIFRLQSDSGSHVTGGPFLVAPGGTKFDAPTYDATGVTWTILVPMAEAGKWKWRVELDGDSDKYIQAQVTAQQRDPNEAPIIAKTWVDTPSGGVDAAKDLIKIRASVMQGNSPVVGAKVKAFLIPPDINAAADEYILLDNGKGADAVMGDGVYSRFMVRFPGGIGRYSVKAQVIGLSTTMVNAGPPPPSNRRRRRSVSQEEPLYIPPPCCGSVVPIDVNTAPRTGSFSRMTAANSVKVVTIPSAGTDLLAPSQVTDLQVVALTEEATRLILSLTWTAPGGDLDDGQASAYLIRLSDQYQVLADNGFDEASDDTLLVAADGAAAMADVLKPYDLPVALNVTIPRHLGFAKTYFVALKAVDEAGNKSPVSNVAFFTVEDELPLPESAMDIVKNLLQSNKEWH